MTTRSFLETSCYVSSVVLPEIYLRASSDNEELVGINRVHVLLCHELCGVKWRAPLAVRCLQVCGQTHADEADLAPCCIRRLLHARQPAFEGI